MDHQRRNANSNDADVTICIYEDGPRSHWRATPGHAVVTRGETVAWENLTTGEVRVSFAAPEIFDGEVTGLCIPAGGSSGPLRIRPGTERMGAHPYLATCRLDGGADCMVEGGSPPMIIIRPGP